ncbi:hypothetical protein QUB56_02740 [Microcoleus sp. AR_TQ3_B6]|uniref:hypothetical protein n=1 Tax=Microcoleus sp. AR_TQ3_B6 TaxID=3055284 RepID=UPI002FD16E76
MDKKFRYPDSLKAGASQSLTDVGERQVYIKLVYIDGSNGDVAPLSISLLSTGSGATSRRKSTLCEAGKPVVENGARCEFKQYRAGGVQEMLKIRQATGRTRVIPSALIAGISQKLSEESCNFNSYK